MTCSGICVGNLLMLFPMAHFWNQIFIIKLKYTINQYAKGNKHTCMLVICVIIIEIMFDR